MCVVYFLEYGDMSNILIGEVDDLVLGFEDVFICVCVVLFNGFDFMILQGSMGLKMLLLMIFLGDCVGDVV